MNWSAADYSRFEAERTQPVHDLIARLPAREFHRIADLGCGPGNSTEALRTRFPRADLIGIDSAPDMLRAARARLPGLRFHEADLGAWAEPGFDLLFANASLHWVPDHARLLPRLLSCLRPGGVLAIQVPDHYREAPHRLLREAARAMPASERLKDAEHALIHHTPRWYLSTLRRAGASVSLWRTIYFHQLEHAEAIVTWFQATAMRPYLAPLSETERADFLAGFLTRIAKAFPPLKSGGVLLPFPRLFLLAEPGAYSSGSPP